MAQPISQGSPLLAATTTAMLLLVKAPITSDWGEA
jgi:hypothetical protein